MPSYSGTVKIDKLSYPPEIAGMTLSDYHYSYIDGQWKYWFTNQSEEVEMIESKIFVETTESIRIHKFIMENIHAH